MFIDKLLPKDKSLQRHFAKTITWRIIGTVDTMILGWIVTGSPVTGLKIGGLEVLTKMVLYFIHERVWYKINFGVPQREKSTEVKIVKQESLG